MSEQDGTEATAKRRRSRKTSTANQQNDKQVRAAQRLAIDDRGAWKEEQTWRTEPEIDTERQKYLADQRSITPNAEQGLYPFKGIKLSRADIEWLLATHESEGVRGPVDWEDEQQRNRKGLDLGGADLRHVNLSGLPLARVNGSGWHRLTDVAQKQFDILTIRLEGANLSFTHLEGANLFNAHLEEAYAYGAHLESAYLSSASLERICLNFAHLEKASLLLANLAKASLKGAHLEGAIIDHAHLEGTILSEAFFDNATQLKNVVLYDEQAGRVSIADIRWGDVNLAVIDWSQVKMLGDEQTARQEKDSEGNRKNKQTRMDEYKEAVRANRQLAVVLRDQGLNEEADRFAYRAQKLQRAILYRQRKFGQYAFSLLLDLLAGYGYRPGRSVIWYLVVILGFALVYHVFGGLSLFPPDAVVFSIMSFHGRGFFPALSSETNLHNPLVMLAALEAIIGLLIEISFIATFTQRFFGK